MKPQITRYRYRMSTQADYGWAAYLPQKDKIVILKVSKKLETLQAWLKLNVGRYDQKPAPRKYLETHARSNKVSSRKTVGKPNGVRPHRGENRAHH